MAAEQFVAERELLYSLKGSGEKLPLRIRVSEPCLLSPEDAGFNFDEGTAYCVVVFEGLPDDPIKVYGIDSLHALSQATDIDAYLRGMKKYDFFWSSGEDYFEE